MKVFVRLHFLCAWFIGPLITFALLVLIVGLVDINIGNENRVLLRRKHQREEE